MRRAPKYIITAAICISLLLQTGCWDQKLFEQIGFMLQMGLELDQEGELLFSMTSPVVAPDVEAKTEFLYTSSGNLIRASRERLRNAAGKMLQGGKVQQVYFSKELAGTGINEFFEIYLRHPENPLLANIVVVDGSPKEMMELSIGFKDKPRPAYYVNELLQDARRRSNVPETRVYNFSTLYYSRTIDPVTPMLRYDKECIEVAGSAVFSTDRMVGQLDTDQTLLLLTLMGKKKIGEYVYHGQATDRSNARIKRGAAMLIKSSKRKVKINTSGSVPVIDIKLDLRAVLHEYTGAHNLDETEYKKVLEEKVAETIKAESLELIKYLQTVGSDPVGFGEMVRSKQNRYWKSVNWKQVYKTAAFNVAVKLRLESYGTIR